MVNLEKRNHVTLFCDAAMILRDGRAHVFVSKDEVLHLHNIVLKAKA